MGQYRATIKYLTCVPITCFGKQGPQQRQGNTRPKKPQGRVHTHTRQKVLAAMFTAGNMTYMRKRKKERQAAKRAMARENVS